MNKNILIVVGVVAVLLLGVGGFLVMNSGGNPSSTANTNAQQTETKMEKMSLKSLMSMAGNQTCTFNDTSTGNSGTSYISSGKMRGDFTSKAGEQTIMSHILSDGENVYMWTDDQEKGFKVAYSSIDKLQGAEQQTVDINTEVDYSCSSWNPDAAKFVVPSDITFTDYSGIMEEAGKMMEKLPSGTTMQDTSSACAACDNLPSDAKASCRAALKCE